MRHYTDIEEQRIRAQGTVSGWARLRLIEEAQATRLLDGLRVELRRTNSFLRIGLAAFTAVVVIASVMVPVSAFDLSTPAEVATLTGIAAIVCLALADVLAGKWRLYDFGVEEMLAVAGVFLLGVSASQLWEAVIHRSFDNLPQAIGLSAGACGGFWVYRRFGHVYAAAASMLCLAAIPFQFGATTSVQRASAAAIAAALLIVVRQKRLQHGDEWPGDEYGQLQAVAWAAVYAALNLQLGRADVGRGFYWFTYAMTFVLPAVGLALGVRDKDRPLLNASILMALVTLVTNKPYLDLPRYEWDPILLGVVLVAVALGTRRWLAKGQQGQRDGFTADPVAAKDRPLLTLLSAVPFGAHPHTHVPASPAEPPSGFDGGRSGGAGGGAGF